MMDACIDCGTTDGTRRRKGRCDKHYEQHRRAANAAQRPPRAKAPRPPGHTIKPKPVPKPRPPKPQCADPGCTDLVKGSKTYCNKHYSADYYQRKRGSSLAERRELQRNSGTMLIPKAPVAVRRGQWKDSTNMTVVHWPRAKDSYPWTCPDCGQVFTEPQEAPA